MVRPARNHLWSEPLDQGLLIYLRSSVSAALGEQIGYRAPQGVVWDQVVDVFVEQLHGTMTGRALIVAAISCQVLKEKCFSGTIIKHLAKNACVAQYWRLGPKLRRKEIHGSSPTSESVGGRRPYD